MTAMPQPLLPEEQPTPALPDALPALETVYTPQIVYIESEDDFDVCLHNLERVWDAAKWAQQPLFLQLDTEADGKDARTAVPLLLQVAASQKVVYVIPLNKNRPDLGRLWELAHQFRVQVVGHNLSYDYKLLRAHGLLPPLGFPRVYDTQLAELVLTTGHFDQKALWLKSVALKSVTAKYLGLGMDKDVRNSFIGTENHAAWEPTDEQLVYGALDVAALFDIERKQLTLLKEERLIESLRLRLNALMPVVEMELRGMRIDQDAWRTYLKEVEAEREQVEAQLVTILSPHEWAYREQKFFEETRALKLWEQERDLVLEQTKQAWEGGDRSEGWGAYKLRVLKLWRDLHPRPPKPDLDYSPINLDSPKQKLRALNALGLELDSTSKLSRARALRGELEEKQREVLVTYQRFSELNQILKGFGENVLAMIDPATGRLHTHFNLHVAETGRWSSEKPNFQNMPRVDTIRHAFIADPDMVVITADYSGQELAIVAALADCFRMKQDIMLGKDLYKEVAALVWKIRPEDVTKDQRQKAKSALLGINYGLSAKGLENNHGIARAEGEALLEAVKAKYPQVVEWGDKMAEQAFKLKYVQTPVGTRRYFPDDNMPRWQYDTQGRNMPVQGTAAEIAYRLADRAERNLVPQRILPVNFVHDEVVALAPREDPETSAQRLVAEMQGAFNDILPYARYGMKIRVDYHIASHWTKE